MHPKEPRKTLEAKPVRYWLWAILLALLPFFPEPHLWQKGQWLIQGWLHKPLDWLDLFFHGGGLLLLTLHSIFQFIKSLYNLYLKEVLKSEN